MTMKYHVQDRGRDVMITPKRSLENENVGNEKTRNSSGSCPIIYLVGKG
jgi:hypothetical protein